MAESWAGNWAEYLVVQTAGSMAALRAESLAETREAQKVGYSAEHWAVLSAVTMAAHWVEWSAVSMVALTAGLWAASLVACSAVWKAGTMVGLLVGSLAAQMAALRAAHSVGSRADWTEPRSVAPMAVN